jgi:hypothetical protein
LGECFSSPRCKYSQLFLPAPEIQSHHHPFFFFFLTLEFFVVAYLPLFVLPSFLSPSIFHLCFFDSCNSCTSTRFPFFISAPLHLFSNCLYFSPFVFFLTHLTCFCPLASHDLQLRTRLGSPASECSPWLQQGFLAQTNLFPTARSRLSYSKWLASVEAACEVRSPASEPSPRIRPNFHHAFSFVTHHLHHHPSRSPHRPSLPVCPAHPSSFFLLKKSVTSGSKMKYLKSW